MKDIPNPFDDDDVCDEIDIHKVVAISPDHYVYENYEDIPPIPSPRFLMVKDKTIIADGWLLRVWLSWDFVDFVVGLARSWTTPDEETKRQLVGFFDAIEAEIRVAFPQDAEVVEEAEEEDFDRRY